MNAPLTRLTQQLSASFDNQRQAFDNPPLYGHILVRIRPLPHLKPGSLLLEQAYAITSKEPYRIRVLRAEGRADGSLIINNYAIRDPQRFWGGIEDQSKRDSIQEEDLALLEGCTYLVSETEQGFCGEVEPGCKCMVKRQGMNSYLVSQFELSQTGMRTIDRGHNPETNKYVWGSIAGAFKFDKIESYADEIPEQWNLR